MALGIITLIAVHLPHSHLQFPLDRPLGEVTELVPVPDFKSGGSWLWSGMVSSILMLSRQIYADTAGRANVHDSMTWTDGSHRTCPTQATPSSLPLSLTVNKPVTNRKSPEDRPRAWLTKVRSMVDRPCPCDHF